MVTSIAITPEEHRARCDALLEHARADGLSGVVLFDPYYVLHYAGFAFAPSERPIAFVLAADGTRALVVPRLEREHAEAKAMFDRVEHYLEYRQNHARRARSRGCWTTLASPERSEPTRTGTHGSSAIADRTQLGDPARAPGNIVFQEGDVLVTGASAPVWGSTLGHRPGNRRRRRDPHVLPARPREPDHSRLAALRFVERARRSGP